MELGSVGYVECSAKAHQGVKQMMEEVIRKVIMCREKSRKGVRHAEGNFESTEVVPKRISAKVVPLDNT